MVDAGFWQALRLSIERRQWPLFVTGETGVGKTTAAALAFMAWRARNVEWTTFRRLCEIANRCSKTGECYEPERELTWRGSSLWHSIGQKSLLVIDEVCSRPDQSEVLKAALDERFQKPTIITSNLPLEMLEESFDKPTASRIAAGRIFQMKGEDFRYQGLAERMS